VLKKKGKNPWAVKKGEKSRISEGKRKTLADGDKVLCILMPLLLPHLFVLVFPISYKQ